MIPSLSVLYENTHFAPTGFRPRGGVAASYVYRSFCDRPTQSSWPYATPLCIGNEQITGVVLPLLENHSAYTRLTHLCFLPQQVLRPSWPLLPPSSTMYLPVYSQTPSIIALPQTSRPRSYADVEQIHPAGVGSDTASDPLLSGVAVPSY